MSREINKRDLLLQCALQLFVSYGYDAVGVQQIASAAGVTKPTLYHYFGSKLGLLNALLDEHLRDMSAALQQAAEYRHDLTASLTAVAQAMFSFGRAKPELFRLQLMLWFAPQQSEPYKFVAQRLEAHHAIVEQLFVLATADHGNMQGRQRTYAASFLGVLNTYIGLALNGYTTLDDALLQQLLHQFMHGIFS